MNCFPRKQYFWSKSLLVFGEKYSGGSNSIILAVKLTEVLFCQFVLQKTSCPGCALVRLCLFFNTHLYYHYCSEFSVDGPCLVTFFMSWSTASSSELSKW